MYIATAIYAKWLYQYFAFKTVTSECEALLIALFLEDVKYAYCYSNYDRK
jgi:hypothetical protein